MLLEFLWNKCEVVVGNETFSEYCTVATTENECGRLGSDVTTSHYVTI